MREDIRTVRFVGMQGTDELFRCIENKKVYIRRCYEEPYAEWLTTTSWSGGMSQTVISVLVYRSAW